MKRFTGTEKWDKVWFRKLPPRLKCLWFYILDRCDNAGIWDADFETASYFIGEKVSEADIGAFGGRLLPLPYPNARVQGGDSEPQGMGLKGKIWLPEFVSFQYGELSEKVPPHKPVIKRLNSLGLPFAYPSNRVQEKEKDKEKDKEGERGVGKGESEIPDRDQAIAQAGMAPAIPPDFAGYVYDDWASRGGRDGGNVIVPWLPYVTKRWQRERESWMNNTHKGNPKKSLAENQFSRELKEAMRVY